MCNERAELFEIRVHPNCSPGSISATAVYLCNKYFSNRSEGKIHTNCCDPLLSWYVLFIDFILPPRGQ